MRHTGVRIGDGGMAKPKCDWRCVACGDEHSLPINATCCPNPECGGLIERIWTPIMVNTDHAKRVDAIAEPVLSKAPAGQRPPAPAVPENARTRIVAPAAAMGMVPAASQAFSRGVVTPALGFMRGKGPVPRYER